MATGTQGHGLLGDNFTCLICGLENLQEEDMRFHVLHEHVEHNNISCSFCDLSGITSDEMNLHINTVHLDDLTMSLENDEAAEAGNDLYSGREDPEKFGNAHGGAIPKTKVTLTHSQSLDHGSASSKSLSKKSGITASHSETSLHKRGKLHLNFDSVNAPLSSGKEKFPLLSSSHHVKSATAQPLDQTSRLSLQSSGTSHTDPILEEGQDNNNYPLQPNLNNLLQSDINDNVEPDINSNTLSGYPCPLCQFVTSSENIIQTHVNMAHVDVLSPAKPATVKTSTSQHETLSQNSAAVMVDEYLCPICMKAFTDIGGLNSHVSCKHAQIFSPENHRAGPMDEMPGTAGIGSSGAREACSAATGFVPCVFLCPVCEMEFGERSRLEAHVNGHFSAEQTPVIERNDRLIAQALQEKETDIAQHIEKKEFQKLQELYGMADGTPYKKQYERNLERAVSKGDMTVVQYHEQKNKFRYADAQGIDDGSSCTKGVIERLLHYYKNLPLGISKAILCSAVDHYAGSFGDRGWGCGYRNFQMLLSALIADPTYCKVLFNDRPIVPSIPKIQCLIEAAWAKGFDKQGCEQLGSRVLNTTKWIGATEIVATLSSLGVKCRLLDFHNPSGPNGTHPRLFQWVKAYFEKPASFKPPLYLQHLGHSRTIIGIEEMKDKSIKLLIFDPSHSKKQMHMFHSIINANVMRFLRKPLESLKSKQYQIVVVTEVMGESEYKEHRVLRSERLS